MIDYFESSLEHVFAELKRVEMSLRLQVARMRQADQSLGDDRFRGLYVSDGQIDSILSTPSEWLNPDQNTSCIENRNEEAREAFLRLEQRLIQKKEESKRRGIVLRLDELTSIFGLSNFETDALLLCLLTELELKYERLYSYVQDDVTKKKPTVDTAIRLLSHTSQDELALRQFFHPSAFLFKHNLLSFADDRMSSNLPLLARQLEIDERVAAFLLGFDQVDAGLLRFVRVFPPLKGLAKPEDGDHTAHRLAEFAAASQGKAAVIYLRGGAENDKSTTVEGLCGVLKMPLLVADVRRIAEEADVESLLGLVFREAKLQKAVVYFESGDRLISTAKETAQPLHFLDEVAAYAGWVIVSGEQDWQPSGLWRDKPFVSIEYPLPEYSARCDIWKNYGKEFKLDANIDLTDLAGRFRLSTGQIQDALLTARNLAVWRSPANCEITLQELETACRKLSRPGLNALAQKTTSNYRWKDIVLPREQLGQLREICNYVKFNHTVYGEWGFGLKLSRSKGLNVLFAGPSGTGKTMAAEIMASELGFDLYKIDLSTIVSKYIGETEKNLDRIFREAQLSNAILFFDEADALFGKRSEVRDSHDRYANIEIAYLLQKMEDYDGVVILATNLRKNMDDAFARRMHFAVEFPVPEEEDRKRIWEGIFPSQAPLAADVDFSFMARQFRITGGNIRNIALTAAFMAAGGAGCIDMDTLVKATKREYQKIGKLRTEGEFAQYFDSIKS